MFILYICKTTQVGKKNHIIKKCFQDIPWITADIILQAVIISTYAEPTVPEQV